MNKIYYLQQFIVFFTVSLKRFRETDCFFMCFKVQTDRNKILASAPKYVSKMPQLATACVVGFQQDVGIVSRGSPMLVRWQ